jgi:hypothetical protein
MSHDTIFGSGNDMNDTIFGSGNDMNDTIFGSENDMNDTIFGSGNDMNDTIFCLPRVLACPIFSCKAKKKTYLQLQSSIYAAILDVC